MYYKSIKFKIAFIWMILLFSMHVQAENCNKHIGNYDVMYSGGVFGPGKIIIKPSNQEKGLFEMTAILFDFKAAKELQQFIPVLSLDGVGQCRNGIFKIRFGADAGYHEKFKILGGSTVGIFEPEVMDTRFGRWEFHILEKENNKTELLTGVWQIEGI